MARLLVAGIGPLPPEQPGRLFAPGLRIWGIARELARAGHAVRLVRGRFGDGAAGEAALFDLEPAAGAPRGPAELPPMRTRRVAEGGWPQLLAHEATQFNATAAVGSTDVMNHALAATGLPLPIWMDYFGDPMAERQMLALAHGSDQGLADQWALVAPALARADRLSGCSREQCAALRGQLAAVGRLGRLTATEPLVHEIPPWIEPVGDYVGGARPAERLLRGVVIPEDSFLVVQTGGFNTWLDVKSLFSTLERVMADEPRLHFAATGGPIAGHHESGFEWFQAAVGASPHADRFHLLGWRPLADVPRLLAEADLAINFDLPCIEGRHGTRNRLLDWLLAELPVISTPGCELAEELGQAGYLLLTPHGAADRAAAAIRKVMAGAEEFRQAATRGAHYLREVHAPERCLAPLLAWAAEPKPASDLHLWRRGTAAPSALHAAAVDAAALACRLAAEQAQRLRLEQELAELKGSRLIQWALRLRRGGPSRPRAW